MPEDKTRLHIAPFSKDLLSAILPSSAVNLAEQVSYHTLQTFPENNYGFIELPVMEAEKIKKKLNGSILKGKKIRIEEARPRKRPLTDDTEGDREKPVAETDEVGTKSKRVKHDRTAIMGHELSPDRIIKRGWTEPKKGKEWKRTKGLSDQAASKYSDKEELLFKTVLPPNKAKQSIAKARKGRGTSGDVLVHEFQKSTIQPSFLRDPSAPGSKRATEYVDGRGWVDENGQILQEEVIRPAKSEKAAPTPILRSLTKKRVRKSPSPAALASSPSNSHNEDVDETSSSGISSDTESDETVSSNQASASKATSVEESSAKDSSTAAVHPLEAIFKRPSKAASDDIPKPSLEVQTSFSFFEPDANSTLVPDTPFNSQDLSSRELRSAAPTPDTAAPSRYNSWGSGPGRPDSIEEDDEEQDFDHVQEATPSRVASKDKEGQDSDFAKFFWESRGDNNRTWKRRKREANKETRQRENRARSRKS